MTSQLPSMAKKTPKGFHAGWGQTLGALGFQALQLLFIAISVKARHHVIAALTTLKNFQFSVCEDDREALSADVDTEETIGFHFGNYFLKLSEKDGVV